jgi:hypothetical protein
VIRTIGRVFAAGFVSFVCASGFASAQSLAVPIPQPPDPLLTNLTIPSNAHTAGMWSPVHDWSLNPIHMVVMPDGRVVTFGSALADAVFSNGVKFDIWNPRRGFVQTAHRVLANIGGVDSFCAASTLLKTGELLTSGGKVPLGNKQSVLLNASRNAVMPGVDMASPRYYSTQTALPDGRVLVTGGSIDSRTTWSYEDPWNHLYEDPSTHLFSVSATPEVFTHGTGWSNLALARSLDNNTGADTDGDYVDDAFGPGDNHWWYPRQWVAPNGKVFGFSTRQMWYLDPDANSGQGSIALGGALHADGVGASSKPNIGASSTAVMYDIGRILQVGGNGRVEGSAGHDNFPSSELATIIDINSGTANLTPAASLPAGRGRQWANATALPDGRVLLTGGTAFGNSEDFGDPVHEAAIWNPTAGPGAGGAWTTGASASVNRGYHSSAVLLPNGTVLTGGGGAVNNHPGRLNVEVYSPPYLFQASGGGSALAPRPRVLSMNAVKFSHGATIQAQISADHTIAKAALIGLGSTTHSFDMGQRLIPFSAPLLTVSDSIASFQVPNQNLAPPGYYLLFVTNSNGVPSEGVIVAIGANVAPPPRRSTGPQFDVDGDGKTELALWRPLTAAQGGSVWYIARSSDSVTQVNYWGEVINGVQDIPVTGDYDGDGKTDLALWRPRTAAEGGSMWYIARSSDGVVNLVGWGEVINGVQDIPVPGDYDGDGKTDLALWRPRTAAEGGSMWYIARSSDGVVNLVGWGEVINGVQDIPIPGDYDGDGKTDLALLRPRPAAEGGSVWYIARSSDSVVNLVYWGDVINGVQDIPVTGDYDGDGRTDLALWRPLPAAQGGAVWYIARSSDSVTKVVYWGDVINGVQDIPVVGDYDGDGKTDLALWRPRTIAEGGSVWYISRSSDSVVNVVYWGEVINGVQDVPILGRREP